LRINVKGKKAESEAPGAVNFRFVVACASGKIVKIVGPDSQPFVYLDILSPK
jgi:hypothetical protein